MIHRPTNPTMAAISYHLSLSQNPDLQRELTLQLNALSNARWRLRLKHYNSLTQLSLISTRYYNKLMYFLRSKFSVKQRQINYIINSPTTKLTYCPKPRIQTTQICNVKCFVPMTLDDTSVLSCALCVLGFLNSFPCSEIQ